MENTEYKKPEKPLGQRAYGSIPHLPGSRRGPADKGLSDQQARILTEKCRDKHAHIIVEDEGPGFKDVDKWNKFNQKRQSLLEGNDFEALADYVSFRGAKADENDGGNALFAALEYWDGGFVFNSKKNCVAMLKRFPKKRRGVAVENE